MKVSYDKIYNSFLNSGIVLLAISITFSITLMNTAFGFLCVAFLILLFKKKVKFYSTGLEIPLLIFVGFYLLSASIGPQPLKSIKDVLDNYWYVFHMYIVVYLFGEKETVKFIKILGWSAFIMAVYAILQSMAGLTLPGSMKFQMVSVIRMGASNLEKVTELFGFPVYMATGILGHHLTFGGQMMMLTFVAYASFKKRLPVLLVFLSLILSFAYSCWVGFISALIIFFAFKKKRILYSIGIILIFAVLLIFVPLNRQKIKDKFSDRINIWKTSFEIYSQRLIFGVGAGQYTYIFDREYAEKYPGAVSGARCHPHSIYFDMLTEGGILTFLAFIFFLFKFFKLYSSPPKKEKWRRLHTASLFALAAILAAGVFQTYLTDAENSVLIWTLAGLIINIKKLENEQHSV